MSKNLVVFSDGTGQEGGVGNNSNVYKLYNMIEDRTDKQISYYDRGLGTGWRKVTGNVGGMGISKNIQECYEFIFDNFTAGDKIYLFGFSRGATTVRSLSNFIHLFGILPKSRRELIKQAYNIYKIGNKEHRDQEAKNFIKKHHTMWTRIHFLGVWDTVAALGIPLKCIDVILDKIPFFRHKFQDLRLSDSVENAYHALAIDEERKTFHPTLWDNDKKFLKNYQSMKQVWFCGVHTDVGGGYEEQELSNIPLFWMMYSAVEHGLRIYKKDKVEIIQDINGKMHDSRGGTLSKLYRKEVRSWNSKTHGMPTIHQSVLQRTLNKQNKKASHYKPWILNLDFKEEPWIKELSTT